MSDAASQAKASETLVRGNHSAISPVRAATRVIVMVLLLTGFSAPWARAAETIQFLAIGDAGSGTQIQKDVAEAMALYAEQNRATAPVNFVLVLGDNFYESGVTSVDDLQWEQKFEKMYDRERLAMPFIATLGNHDWRGNVPDIEIEYTRAHPGTRWQMDGHWFKRHYSVAPSATGGALEADFFMIDTEVWNPRDQHVAQYADKQLGEKQMKWLREELSHSKAVWKFVAGHHPLYSNGQHGHDRDVLALREKLVPLLREFQVDAYLSGHDHDLQRIEIEEAPTLFLISGAAGKLRTKRFDECRPFYAAAPGFLAVQLSPAEMRGAFIDAKGHVLDQWTRPPLSLKQSPADRGQK